MSDPPVPIKPELAIEAAPAQRLAEKIGRDLAKFETEQGVPVAYALVLIDAAGTTEPFYQTEGFDGVESPARGGWRGFLALAGARLLAVAVDRD